MIVCIAEKPSVAKDIARILGANSPREGYYEGNGYQVTWTFGHLCELKNPEDYTPLWKSWSLGALPMVPERFGIRLKQDKGIERQFAVIERLFQSADCIINCGDAGQEGELIQRWVLQKSQATCPVKRLWISSMTDEAIRDGFANLRDHEAYNSLYEAGLCRAIGDWLLGMNATRLYTLKYAPMRSKGEPVLSIGRVQTPTLALIVKRQEEIENFVPQPYWVLTTLYRNTTFTAVLQTEEEEAAEAEKQGATANSANNNALRRGFTSKEEGEAALERIKNSEFFVTQITKKSGTEAPPRLYDLTSLQVECNKKFGYSSDLTLQLIQSLYEKKLTTYPRVDTTYLSDDVYPKCGGIMNGIYANYKEIIDPLRGAPLKKSKKVFDNAKITDHHAIIPTGEAPRALTDIERNVYDLVARRFISVFYPDCKFSTTTVLGEAAEVPFKATGKMITDPGWRAVYAKDRDKEKEDNDEERFLPEFVKGEHGPHEPNLAEKQTQPPKPYTEATLLRAMETAGRFVDDDELRDAMKENGIGRPSTRAAIIQTLFSRNYIRLQRKSLIATPRGVQLIGLIKEELLKSAELTGRWEKKLREIERREYQAKQFVMELKDMVQDIVFQVLSDNTNRMQVFEATQSTEIKSTHSSNDSESEDTKAKRKVIRAGSTCPKCGEGKVIKGNTAYGCSRWKEGCDWRKPFK
ncbi:MAG: DNA topoisomerase 3 [Bacteroidaceae bacterium]|nr:DNA topoisomerase 3 [Bacteroidaceae bacterium]